MVITQNSTRYKQARKLLRNFFWAELHCYYLTFVASHSCTLHLYSTTDTLLRSEALRSTLYLYSASNAAETFYTTPFTSFLNEPLTRFVCTFKKEEKVMKKILLLIFVLLACFSVIAQSYTINSQREKEQKLNDLYCSGLFKTAYGTIIDLTDNTSAQGYFNILDWLQGRVAGLQIYINRYGNRIPFIRGSRAAIFVDEMQVDAGYLNALTVNDIAMIKVIKEPFVGSFGANSAVAVYTIKSEEGEDE